MLRGNNPAMPIKIKTHVPLDSEMTLLGIYLTGIKLPDYKHIYAKMTFEQLFAMTKVRGEIRKRL